MPARPPKANCVDGAGAEVGGKEKYSVDVDAENQTFIDGAVGGIRRCELSTAMTALSAGVRPPVQAEIVPSSVSKMKVAARSAVPARLVPGLPIWH